MIRPILMMTNRDEVSGTTIYDDGTKIFWAEGRSSDIVVINPAGARRRISAFDLHDPVIQALEHDGEGAIRMATEMEEEEWLSEREWGGE